MKEKIRQILFVAKSNGSREKFSEDKLLRSIILAGKDTKAYKEAKAKKIFKEVMTRLLVKNKKNVTSLDIRDVVEPVMAEKGYFKTARYYILFQERKDRKKLEDFHLWEPVMVDNAKETLVSRCSMEGPTGNLLETPGQIFWRVARHLAKAEINWADEKEVDRVAKIFFDKMANFKFVCTRGALYEAGNDSCMQQLSPCFVLKIEDSIDAIFRTLGEAALVQKNYGGTGFNFSRIRLKGDRVRSVSNVASGPVDFLQVYSAALSKVVQGAKRHGGNMGILNVTHPDIYDFIKVKDQDGTMKNFNISVGATNEFMDAVIANRKFNLINPRDGQVVKTVNARELFDDICEHAWRTGDPGMIFLDRMEEDNYTPTLGKLEATNPCGEQPLLPYESCNLSSVHLASHLVRDNDGKWEINWNDLADTVKVVVRFLDNMIETNKYVLTETERIVRNGNRKIGLGVIGLGETFFKLGIGYDSADAVRVADKVAKFIKRQAEIASGELAQLRGVFPNWDISTYKGTAEMYRNCTMMTIAPTGTVSMIGNTTSGIEPAFALVYVRRAFYNEDSNNKSTKELYYVEPTFEAVLKERKLYSEKLLAKVAANHGSVKGLKDVPEDLQRIFVTAHDIDPEWHVKIQGAWQKYVDNAVSKTINFRNSATVEDVKKAYLLAWKLGCKGITIYRDGSKDDQVMVAGSGEKTETPAISEKDEVSCPECDGELEHEGGCSTCRQCGWSKCKL